jgi:hypothetical protein
MITKYSFFAFKVSCYLYFCFCCQCCCVVMAAEKLENEKGEKFCYKQIFGKENFFIL